MNPYYEGPPCLGSLDPYSDDPDMEFLDLHEDCAGGRKCKHGYGAPVYGPPRHLVGPSVTSVTSYDDIPF